MTNDPATGTIPTGYLILNVTTGHIKRHAGGYLREIVAACCASFRPDAIEPSRVVRPVGVAEVR